jgi:hypothetical protein
MRIVYFIVNIVLFLLYILNVNGQPLERDGKLFDR